MLGKKAYFTPQNFFRELEGQTFPQLFQRTEKEKKGKKKLRCLEFCFVLSHAAKPKQSLRSKTNKHLCSIPPFTESFRSVMGPTYCSAYFHTEVRSLPILATCQVHCCLPFPRPGPLPRAFLAPPFPGLVGHIDVMGKPKCGNRQQKTEGEKLMLFTQNYHCFNGGGG